MSMRKQPLLIYLLLGALMLPGGFLLASEKSPEENFWSLKPLGKSTIPDATAGYRNEIDRFIVAKLQANRMRLSTPADKRTLLRRVCYDLIGLPPTPEEVEAFLGDDSGKAYERVVDDLLNSPRYGERWARHWLDVVHYAETH